MQNWLCTSTIKNAKNASDIGASLGIPIDGIPVALGFSAKDSKYEQWHQKFCSASFEEYKENKMLEQNLRTISPSLMSVVKRCLDNQQTGFTAWIEPSQDRSKFTYYARYRPWGDEKARIKSFDILPVNGGAKASCRKQSAFKLFSANNWIGNAPTALSCTVNPITTVTVTLNVDKGGTRKMSKFILDRHSSLHLVAIE